jgi:hypothetical protein
MARAKKEPVKQILSDMMRQLEALCFSVAALENASLSENYAGRRLTRKQLTDLKREARKAQLKVFDGLAAKIAALPDGRTIPTVAQ